MTGRPLSTLTNAELDKEIDEQRTIIFGRSLRPVSMETFECLDELRAEKNRRNQPTENPNE